jgi:hypothetical protein
MESFEIENSQSLTDALQAANQRRRSAFKKRKESLIRLKEEAIKKIMALGATNHITSS